MAAEAAAAGAEEGGGDPLLLGATQAALQQVVAAANARRHGPTLQLCREALQELERAAAQGFLGPPPAPPAEAAAPAEDAAEAAPAAADADAPAAGASGRGPAEDAGEAAGGEAPGPEAPGKEAESPAAAGDGAAEPTAGVGDPPAANGTAEAEAAPPPPPLTAAQVVETAVPALCSACDTGAVRLVEHVLQYFFGVFAAGLAGGIQRVERREGEEGPAPPWSRVFQSLCRSYDLGVDAIELSVMKVLMLAVASGAFEVHGEALLLALKTCYNIHLGTRNEANMGIAKICLKKMIAYTFMREARGTHAVEAALVFQEDNVLKQNAFWASVLEALRGMPTATPAAAGAGAAGGRVALENDAYLTFRSLCKLSMKSQGDAGTDALVLRGKLLSLELLKSIVEQSGASLKANEKFVGAIKQFLCLSLIKNHSSSADNVYQLALAIFVLLLKGFRSALKAEIGVFFPISFLDPLDGAGGGHSNPAAPGVISYPRLHEALQGLRTVCQDPQLLADLFVNYDCELEGVSVVERVVAGLARIAQGIFPGDASALTKEQRGSLTHLSLSCIVAVTECLHGTLEAELALGPAADEDGSAEVAEGAGEDSGRPEGGRRATVGGDLDSPSAGTSTEQVEQLRAYKVEYQQGVKLFNKKPKKGIKFMQEREMVGPGAADIAAFLKTQGLDKAKVGEYLGEGDAFNIEVMHSYTDSLEFTALEFSEGIRHFLTGFRLPGEAQKIDRLMLKFADRYCNCNPEAFKSADTAYVLAYSVIMLNTDAHNPQVKKKMSLEEFVKNNRGIDDGEDLPKELLEQLYRNISTNAIKMKEDAAAGAPVPQRASGLDQLFALFGGKQAVVELDDEAVRQTHEDMKRGASEWADAVCMVNIRPMLEVSWAPMLGVFSVLFEDNFDQRLSGLCLQGFKNVVVPAAYFQMEMVRDAYITPLAKFTMLHNPTRMQPKNVQAFETMIEIADRAGDHLQKAWFIVLTTISSFDKLCQARQAQQGGYTDDTVFSSPVAADGPKSSAAKLSGPATTLKKSLAQAGPGPAQPLPEPGLLELIDVSTVARVFLRSEHLDGAAIVHFVQALAEVARAELGAPSPRVYSLTKIVETAHVNMMRIRIVWTKIWAILSDFFVEVSQHPNLSIAMYSVDSLRQLAMKFLEHDELANYTFQNDFLRPFVIVMRQSGSSEIRELIIRCISQFVLARVDNVKSGWKSLFMVFTTAAADDNRAIVALAFETIEKVVREYFVHVTQTETSTFTDCVNCLIAFANTPLLDVALNAIAFLRFCALKLGDNELGELEAPENSDIGAVVGATRIKTLDGEAAGVGVPRLELRVAKRTTSLQKEKLFTDKDVHVFFWFPLLAGLSELTFDGREEIRHSAREVLFDILQYHGGTFTTEFWSKVFDSVLFPIFDNVRAEIVDATTFVSVTQRNSMDAWLFETCSDCLQHVIGLFIRYYGVVCPIYPRLLSLLVGFVVRGHKDVSTMGVAALFRLLLEAGKEMDGVMWDESIEVLGAAVRETAPNFLALFGEGGRERANTHDSAQKERRNLRSGWGARRLTELLCQSDVQVQLVKGLAELSERMQGVLNERQMLAVLDALNAIQAHAVATNEDIALRGTIQALQQEEEVPPEKRIPDPPLLELESEVSSVNLRVLVLLLRLKDQAGTASDELEQKLLDVAIQNLKSYEESTAVEGSISESRAAIAVATLRTILGMDPPRFKKHVQRLFPVLTNLIKCEAATQDVLEVVHKIFGEKVGPLLMSSAELALR